MRKKYLVFIALGCLLSTSKLLVHSLPIKYLENQPSPERDPQRENNTNYQAPQKPLEYADDAGQRSERPENTVGLRLFPKIFEGGSTRLMHPIQGLVRFFPQNGNQTTDAGNQEMTVSVPRLITDRKGNWVYNRWGATYGNVDFDTRFKEFYRGSPPTPQFRAPKKFKKNYYPNQKFEELSTVCNLRSTIYNVPRIYEWLTPTRTFYDILRTRGVWLELRMVLFKDGNSLQCHTPNMTDWSKYIHCALMRNMRMEYLIPGYPRAQYNYQTWTNKDPWNDR